MNSSNATEVEVNLGTESIGEGTYTVYVVEETNGDDTDDTSAQIDSSDSLTYDDATTLTVDDTAPTLDSATKVDATTINVTLSDTGGFDASSIAKADFTLNTSASWNFESDISDDDTTGNVTLTFQNPVDNASLKVELQSDGVADLAGNSQTSGSATVDGMDSVAPSVSAVTVEQNGGDDTVTKGDTVSVSADVSENATGSGVDTVTVDASLLGGSTDLELTDEDGDNTYNATFTVTSGTDGTVTLTVTAADNATNERTATDTVTLDLDTISPAASNYDPADGATVTAKQPTVGVNLTDATTGVDASSISVTVNNTDGSKTYLDGVTTSETGVSWDASTDRLTIDLAEAGVTLEETQVSVNVTVADTDANAATHVWDFTVDVPEKSSGSSDWGRDDDDETETEAPATATPEPSDAATEADDESGRSTAAAVETSDDADDEATAVSTGDDAATDEPTDAATETDSAATDADGGSTETGVPGFGALVAVVALLAAALLARREA